MFSGSDQRLDPMLPIVAVEDDGRRRTTHASQPGAVSFGLAMRCLCWHGIYAMPVPARGTLQCLAMEGFLDISGRHWRGGHMAMWMQHWNLTRDPFSEHVSPYVALPTYDEAVAKLAFAVETAQPRVILAAPAGLGKTVVVRRAIAQSAQLRRRFVSASCPHDEVSLFTRIAERLSQRHGREPHRLDPWKSLERAIRLASLQSEQVIIVVDDCDQHVERSVRRDLDGLSRLSAMTSAGLTIIQIERTDVSAWLPTGTTWSMKIGLKRLTRTEAETYLATKLQWAGSPAAIFTSRAIVRIHALAVGIPRDLERLAQACLIEGADRGLEVINPELVDALAPDCPSGSFVVSA
jgi:type II secretory pathway predicted ATPase ExeA